MLVHEMKFLIYCQLTAGGCSNLPQETVHSRKKKAWWKDVLDWIFTLRNNIFACGLQQKAALWSLSALSGKLGGVEICLEDFCLSRLFNKQWSIKSDLSSEKPWKWPCACLIVWGWNWSITVCVCFAAIMSYTRETNSNVVFLWGSSFHTWIVTLTSHCCYQVPNKVASTGTHTVPWLRPVVVWPLLANASNLI